MIRLPPTGIDISQNDLGVHLQQLDIYKGLLKQGFRKSEILEYFKSRAEKQQQEDPARDDCSPPASTLELYARYELQEQSPVSLPQLAPDSVSDEQSKISASPELPQKGCVDDFLAPSKQRHAQKCNDRSFMPRQSSLLRFEIGRAHV